MNESPDHTLALLRRMDAKLDRLQADVTDVRGRLQRIEGRMTGLDARMGVLETFDGEVTRIDHRLDEHGRRLARVKDATVLADPSAYSMSGATEHAPGFSGPTGHRSQRDRSGPR